MLDVMKEPIGISRPLTYYTSSPLNGQFIVGYNTKFISKF